jgi:hypothetical protein
VLEEERVGSHEVDNMLTRKRENDLYDFCIVDIEKKMAYLLSKAKDRSEKKRFQQCFQFYTLFREDKQNDFLPKGMEHKDTMNRVLYNKIKNMMKVFPEKIYNQHYPSRKLPRHWNLDEQHMDNIVAFVQQYDENLSNFYENDTWKTKQK